MAVLMGLFKSEVLSTLLNPTFDLLIPVAILVSVTASSRMRYVLTGNKSKVVVTNGNPPLFSLVIDVVVCVNPCPAW